MNITRLGMIGTGGMARYHIRQILQQNGTTHITAVCEPSKDNYAKAAQLFQEAGHKPPTNEPDFDKFMKKQAKNMRS